MSGYGDEAKTISKASIEFHYFVNLCFLESQNWIIENIDKIRHIPAVIVQGRFDIMCPVKNAYDLSKAWPEAKFELV